MATNNPRRALIFKIQKKLGTLSTEQLQTVLSSTDDGGDIHVHDLSEPELYDLIVDFAKSEKLKASEDEGMAQLLLLDELISNLLATDVGATGDDPTTLSRTDMSASQTGCPASLQLGLIDSGLQTATPATDIPVQPTQTERGATDDIPPTTGGSTDEIPPTTGGSTDDQPPTASETVMNSRDTQHAERRDKNVQEETENISGSPPSNEVTPPFTLVLIGNKNSIDIGSKNILLEHDQEIHVKESRLYDLFGDHITLINMLGFPSIDTIPEIPEDCAFILLVSNDQHENQYTSGMQWLEETLGKEHSSYVMTVVTHDDSEEISENELQKLKAKSGFSEKRYHTCTRSMMDENEIVDLLEKINDMVSENRRMSGGNQANLDETLKKVPDLPEGQASLKKSIISAVTRQRKDGGHDLKATFNKENSEMNDGTKKGQKKRETEIRENVGGKGQESRVTKGAEKSEINMVSCESNLLQTHQSTYLPTNSGAINVDAKREKTRKTARMEVDEDTAERPERESAGSDDTHIRQSSYHVFDEGKVEKRTTKNKSEAGEDLMDTQQSDSCDKNTDRKIAITSTASARDDTAMPYLTLVLIGETNSIDLEPNNVLLDLDQETQVEKFSSKLYDLCGRHISVINMLGLPNNEDIPLYQSVHAFVLLIPNSQHVSQYTTGMLWFQKTFGKENIPHFITVITHKTDENCESALQDLKRMNSFSEKRCHTCIRSMADAEEIITLLEKIDVMLSERDTDYCCEQSPGNNGDQKKIYDVPHKTKITTEEKAEAETELKCDQLKKHVGAEQSKINYDNREVQCETKEEGVLQMDINEPTHKTICNPFEENLKKRQIETENLLRRLHLQDQHQHMLSSEDFVQIGPPIKKTNEIFERDLVCAFLQRLMMLDYRARYITVQQESSDVNNSQAVQVSDSAVTDDDDLDALFTTNVDIDQSKENHVHPMDVQMAVFHCSDSFLKQKMITKLSQCQYALPLLVPDPHTTNIECPLWTFRQITKTWKISTNKENAATVTMKSMPIYKAEIPMVSFFRLGSMSLSKSQLMNALINNRHDTFFHRNCEGSTKSRHLMDGVAEIAWYCPAGKDNDFFTDCIAFCNLHGDSLEIGKQREILTEMSSVIVVLVPTLEKSQESTEVISMLYKSSKPLIILNADNDCSAVRVKPQKYKLGLKERSQSDVSTDLKKIIKSLLSEPHTSFRLETMAKVSGIIVDEDQKICQNGKSAAMEIVELIKKMDVAKIKDKFLPCQGQLWSNWCKINKELHHLKGDIEKEKGQKSHQLMELREKQCDMSNSKLMRLFTQSLQSLPPKEREYFLTWTQILIDALSTDDLSSILQNYDKTWSEVLVLKKKHDKSAQLKHKQTELELLSKKLQSATFGLEHIFREMGQIYEAHKSLKKPSLGQQPDWTKYPELAADLMISGHPMELMDGDAGHVPLIWISNLLQEVIKKLGDQRVFVLSVLGVQSSGKSTMLNAMFGLQFAVSAGRCTKGAYMQLVKLSEENKDKYQFDYILVVDTEGLRALELAGNATLHRDNELATFVVGLGNMTLINIFGENPADMQDVLQIVVQAFMRMKKVKLSPSCVFVHQNVTDITAAEKNMDGKRRLQEKLDKMAQLAAKEEVCDVECFSDVIAFDVQKDVKYFAQLWEGSPPMAPPNPGYSESVQELKSIILSKAKQSTGITLSHFSTKIQDLWNALMNEHFVFSFKNTQEIAVYRKLEVQYGNWTWALRSEMLNIENQLYPRIEKGQLDKVELSYLNEEMAKSYEEVTKSISTYFEDDKDKEMLVQWRGRFETKIKEFHDDLVRGVKRKLDELIQQNNTKTMLGKKKTEFENNLLQKSKELAHHLKFIANDEEELKAQFNTVWSHWVEELTSDTKPIENINLEEDQHLVLLELGVEWGLIDESKRSEKYKNLSERGDYSDYITMKKSFGGVYKAVKMFFVSHEEQELIRSFINEVEQKCVAAIKSKPVATRGFTSTYLKEVTQNIKSEIQTMGSQRNYVFKKELTVDLSLYVFDRAEGWLLNSHKIYKDKNDVFTYLDSKKNEYYNIFRSFCKGSSSAVVFGEIMCEKLKVSAVEAVCNKTGPHIAGEMRSNIPGFNESRLNLEKHVLKSLAEKEDFNRFISYIRNPRAQVEAFIKEEVKKYMFTTHSDKAQTILKKNIEDITRVISLALFEATEKCKHGKGNIEKWVEEFSSKLKPKLTLDTISCQNFSDINNFEFLKEEIEKGLKSITTEMSKLSLEKVNKCRQKPDQILIDQLCNCCWERCPFCAAVCTNTVKDHSPEKHSVPFHRPNGVKGWHVRGRVDLVIDFCTTLVASDRRFYPDAGSKEAVPYKQYPTAGEKYASWSITADASKLAYWKWFVCRFQKELEDYHHKKFQGRGEIPPDWRNFSKKDAIESLDEMYSL